MRYIYCYTNILNDKKYIGQTNNIERRKREHLSCSKNKKSKSYNDLFHYKIRQYGIENFKFEILEIIDNDNQEFIDEREQYWIKKEKSFVKEKGYNITLGGQGISEYNKKLNNEQINDIIILLQNKTPFSIIKEKYNISYTLISNINHGLKYKQDNLEYPISIYQGLSDDIIERLFQLLLEYKLSFKEIAKELNIGESTVKKINYGTLRKKPNIDYPIRKTTPAKIKAERVKNLLINSDYNTKEIEKIVGVSSETIRRINIGETHYEKNKKYPLRKTL